MTLFRPAGCVVGRVAPQPNLRVRASAIREKGVQLVATPSEIFGQVIASEKSLI